MKSKKIDYLKIIKWIIKKVNSMTEYGHLRLFKKPYICILQEEHEERCLYSTFEDSSSNGVGSIIAAKTPYKYFNYLVKCVKENHLTMGGVEEEVKRWLIGILCLPIEEIAIKADIEE